MKATNPRKTTFAAFYTGPHDMEPMEVVEVGPSPEPAQVARLAQKGRRMFCLFEAIAVDVTDDAGKEHVLREQTGSDSSLHLINAEFLTAEILEGARGDNPMGWSDAAIENGLRLIQTGPYVYFPDGYNLPFDPKHHTLVTTS
jgi:hypothetical protein